MKDADIENEISDDDEIDLMSIFNKLRDNKRFIIKTCCIGFVLGVVVAFSIPKEYTTTVVLAQSTATANRMGNLGSLASFAGIDLQQSAGGELAPTLYPDVLASTPFLLGLFDIRVKDAKNEIETSLFDYLYDYQKNAWWGYVLGLPVKILGLFGSKEKETAAVSSENTESKVIVLSKKQEKVINSLKGRIKISVDKKTSVASLDVSMQSPEISAAIADTVASYLQYYIINYRTEKARKNLEYVEKLYEKSKSDYFAAQESFAKFADENLNIISAKYQTNKTRLENEMNLAYNIYNQTAQQLQLAKINVQDTKPVCVIIQPSVVPSQPSKPMKKIILVGFVFLAFAGACGRVFLKELMKGKKEEELVNE